MDIKLYSDLESLKRDTNKMRRRVEQTSKSAQRAGNLLITAKAYDCFDLNKTIVASETWSIAVKELDRLQAQQRELKNCLQQLKDGLQSERGARKNAVGVRNTLAKLESASNELQFKMKTVLQHSFPQSYSAMVKRVTKQLGQVLPITNQFVVARRLLDRSRVSQVYHCANVKSKDGYVFPSLYLVMSSDFIARNKVEHHVALAHAFDHRKVPAGKAARKADLPKKLKQLLKHERII